MKKLFLPILLLGLATGCEENPVDRPEAPGTGAAVRFEDNGAARTRTTVEADGTQIAVAWNAGDAIGIFGRGAATGDNYPYAAAPEREEPARCTFAALALDRIFSWQRGEQAFYAYYPYDEAAEGAPDAWPVALPTQQTQRAADDAAHLAATGVMKAAPVACVCDEEEPAPVGFVFRNVFSIVELRLKMDASSSIDVPIRRIRLVSETAPLTIAAGTLDLTAPAEEDPLVIADGKQEAVLVFGEQPVLKRSGYASFYLTVAPGEHAEGLTLEVTAADNSTCTVELPATAFKANRNYRQEATLLLGDFEPAEPFAATAAATECKAGETLLFMLSGEAETVDFYSGEKFHEWEYAKKDRMSYSDVYFSFSSQLQGGTQIHPLKVKVSADFDGEYKEANILNATWTDITARFTLPAIPWKDNNGPTKEDRYLEEGRMIASGEVNLSPYYDEKSPYLYVAFFYHIDKYDAKLENTRTIMWFTDIAAYRQEGGGNARTAILSQTKDEIHIIKGNSTSDWGTTFNHNGVTFYPWRFNGDVQPANDLNAYAVMNKLERKVTNFGPDKPENVKPAQNDMPKQFGYAFAEPGTYEVVLVGRSKTLTGETEKVCKFTVTVKP